MYRYTGAGIGPDVTTSYSYSGSNKSGGTGGGYDYGSLISGLMGGGKQSQPSTGGMSLRGQPTGGGSGGLYSQYIDAINNKRPAFGYGAVGNMAIDGFNNVEAMDKMLPYMMAEQQAQSQQAGQMDLARLNGGISLAQAQMQAEAERQARLQSIADNEKNRQLQLEVQRRGAQQDDYQTKQQFHYQYGI